MAKKKKRKRQHQGHINIYAQYELKQAKIKTTQTNSTPKQKFASADSAIKAVSASSIKFKGKQQKEKSESAKKYSEYKKQKNKSVKVRKREPTTKADKSALLKAGKDTYLTPPTEREVAWDNFIRQIGKVDEVVKLKLHADLNYVINLYGEDEVNEWLNESGFIADLQVYNTEGYRVAIALSSIYALARSLSILKSQGSLFADEHYELYGQAKQAIEGNIKSYHIKGVLYGSMEDEMLTSRMDLDEEFDSDYEDYEY